MTKQVAIKDFLTDKQIQQSIALFKEHKDKCVTYIKQQVIAPNLAIINDKLGQKNDASYLAYAVYYVLTKSSI